MSTLAVPVLFAWKCRPTFRSLCWDWQKKTMSTTVNGKLFNIEQFCEVLKYRGFRSHAILTSAWLIACPDCPDRLGLEQHSGTFCSGFSYYPSVTEICRSVFLPAKLRPIHIELINGVFKPIAGNRRPVMQSTELVNCTFCDAGNGQCRAGEKHDSCWRRSRL